MRILKGAVTSEKRTPVVFLHDAAIDEFIASMLLTVMPGIDLLGIVVINADCIADPAMQASSRLMQFMNRAHIPVALSRARGWNAFPWPYRGDCVSFNELPSLKPYTPHVSTPPPDGEALLAKLLDEAIQKHSPITLLMTGPMTPLVDVLGKNPLLAAGIDGIRSQLKPPPPIDGIAYGLAEVTNLPTTLADALDALEVDTLLREMLGEEFIKLFIAVKRHEIGKANVAIKDFESPTFGDIVDPWERNELFEFL